MFDLNKTSSPKLFNLTPEIVRARISASRDCQEQLIGKIEPMLADEAVPPGRRAVFGRYYKAEVLRLAGINEMLAHVSDTPLLVNREEWVSLHAQFPIIDVDYSAERIRSAAIAGDLE